MTLNEEIESEQRHGRQKYGGDENNYEHDDGHSLAEWLETISLRIEVARDGTPMEARQELVKIAGLAKSAVESFDRNKSRIVHE